MSNVQPPGWYHAEGDPEGTNRYWDGSRWVGEPVAAQSAPTPPPMGGPAPGGPAPGMPMTGSRVTIPGPHPNLAEGGTRLGARVIDAIILFIINLVVVFPIAIGSGGLSGGEFVLFFILTAAIGFLYEVVPTVLKGGSPGKLMLGLGVVKKDGSFPIDWTTGTIRWGAITLVTTVLQQAVPILGFLVSLGVLIASLIWIFGDSDPYKQSAFDRVAGTYVVRTK